MNTIPSLLTDYREYLEHERQVAKATVTAYLSDLRTLEAFVQKPVEEMGMDDLRAFMRHMSKNGIRTATIHRKIAGFTTFWKWLKLQHVVDEVITERIRLPRLQQKAPTWLTVEELERFINTPAQGSTWWVRLRNGLAWKTLAWFGLRRGELLNLRIGDVRLSDKLIVIRETKGKRDRVLPIPSQLLPDLERLMTKREEGDYLFSSVNGKEWKKDFFMYAFRRHLEACQLADIGITPHTLRHTCATHLRQKGVPIEVVKDWLGHKDIKTTLKYLHFGSEQFDDAMERHILNDLMKTP